MANEVFLNFETILHENMGDAIENMTMAGVDDPILDMLPTMTDLGFGGRPETSGDNIYEARRKVKLSRGGGLSAGTFDFSKLTRVGSLDDLPIGTGALDKAMDPTKIPFTQYASLKVQLRRILGMVTLHMQQLIADSIGDALEEMAVGNIEDAVFHIRKMMASWLYSDGTGMLATSAKAATTNISTDTQTAFALGDGTISRFEKGQRYQVFEGTPWPGTKTERTSSAVVTVTNILDNTDEVEFELASGSTIAVEENDVFTLEGTTSGNNSLVPNGIEYLFAETGEFHGIAAREVYQELISYVEGSESNKVEPEPERLSLVYDRMIENGIEPPTVFVSERSMQTQYAYLEKAGFASYNVPGVMPKADGGVTGAQFTHGSLSIPWVSSAYIRRGMLWGASPDTILKFMPGGDQTVRWWNSGGSGAGIPGIFVPYFDKDSGRQTELWQAPFETYANFMAINAKRNFRYLGLHTQKTA